MMIAKRIAVFWRVLERTTLCYVSLVVCVALASCAAPTIRTAINPTATFDRYQTFSMGPPEGAPKGFTASPQSAEVQRRLRPLIAPNPLDHIA